jgi:hypothetical protein
MVSIVFAFVPHVADFGTRNGGLFTGDFGFISDLEYL